ncbi:hypothetical protein EKH57_08985 [Halorubrum sp. BOL3-1]|uniref:hypothetical protein n=1 Tax=Halorubrum sp. BOL3-1 TaxID=2497325 RepID=UPI001004F157|nr:hypothetical protein [Halorubrum sp. BOL3-1]QAU12849.1 hypothetical protein EKH57_08985 [Halorubrum sp. BOL3-1]
MKRRNLILLLGGGGSAALSTGTGAFSSASAERGVEVSVVDDEMAYVGYEALPGVEKDDDDNEDQKKKLTVKNGRYYALVRVANRFPGSAEIEIVNIDFGGNKHLIEGYAFRVSDGDEYELMEGGEVRDPSQIDKSLPSEPFEAGEYADILAKTDGEPGDYTIELTISVKGDEDTAVSAEVFGDTRAFILDIEEGDGVVFGPGNGNSGVEIRATDGGTYFGGEDDVEATIYYEENSGRSNPSVKTLEEVEIPTNTTWRLNDFEGQNPGGPILGVAVDGVDDVFDRGKAPSNSNNDNNRYGSVSETVQLEHASFYGQLDNGS